MHVCDVSRVSQQGLSVGAKMIAFMGQPVFKSEDLHDIMATFSEQPSRVLMTFIHQPQVTCSQSCLFALTLPHLLFFLPHLL